MKATTKNDGVEWSRPPPQPQYHRQPRPAAQHLSEACEDNPRTLNLLTQAAWLASARSGASDIEPGHVHAALRQVPIGNAKIQKP